MFPPHAFRFLSGRGGGSNPAMGATPPPVPIPTPPVSNAAPAVTAVQDQLRKQMLRRKSLATTLYAAGGMGGAMPGGPMTGSGPSAAISNGPSTTG